MNDIDWILDKIHLTNNLSDDNPTKVQFLKEIAIYFQGWAASYED